MIELSQMVRTAIFVTDLDRSVAFYREVLGLTEEFYAGELTDGNAHELLGMPVGTHTKAVILKAPGPAFGMVGLFELAKPQPQRLSKDNSTTNRGECCLVFYCKNLDPVVACLDAKGHAIICRPIRLQIGDFLKQREMTFRDPDGVMINLIEWDPNEERRPEHAEPPS